MFLPQKFEYVEDMEAQGDTPYYCDCCDPARQKKRQYSESDSEDAEDENEDGEYINQKIFGFDILFKKFLYSKKATQRRNYISIYRGPLYLVSDKFSMRELPFLDPLIYLTKGKILAKILQIHFLVRKANSIKFFKSWAKMYYAYEIHHHL